MSQDFKPGDRVEISNDTEYLKHIQRIQGEVLHIVGEWARVRFDRPVPGGHTLNGKCPMGFGFVVLMDHLKKVDVSAIIRRLSYERQKIKALEFLGTEVTSAVLYEGDPPKWDNVLVYLPHKCRINLKYFNPRRVKKDMDLLESKLSRQHFELYDNHLLKLIGLDKQFLSGYTTARRQYRHAPPKTCWEAFLMLMGELGGV